MREMREWPIIFSFSHFLIFSIFSISSICLSQTFQFEKMGVRFGVSVSLGTHLNQFSLLADGFFLPTDRFQINANIRAGYTAKGYGPQLERNEARASVGALLGFGQQVEEISPFISQVGNQTGFAHSVGYAYNFYLDDIKTSQRTGTISIEVDRFFLITENDAFADPILDRFRTGTMLLGYQQDDWRIAISSLLWTGDPASQGRRNLKVEDYPARFGIVDLSDATYGRYSHGVLSMQLERFIPLGEQVNMGQIVRAELGVDAEQVRHVLQNRLIHDAFLLPKKWNKVQNRHVPMLDVNGFPYVFLENQQIRKPRFFGEIHLNPALFW
jgi:hypothetical protein